MEIGQTAAHKEQNHSGGDAQQDIRRLVPGLTLEATVDLTNSAAIWLDLGSLR